MIHSIEAEKGVLGCLLMLGREGYEEIGDLITSKDFYTYGEVMKTIENLYATNKPIDIISVNDSVNELELLSDMASNVPTTSNLKHYATIVSEKSSLRQMLKLATAIENNCHQETSSEDIITNIYKTLEKISKTKVSSVNEARDIVVTVLDKIESMHQKKSKIIGIETGFGDLDYILSGLNNTDLIIVAARPAMGKTSLALNFIEHITIKNKLPALMFSLEMSKEQLIQRIISSLGMIDNTILKTGRLSDKEMETVAIVSNQIIQSPLLIDDSTTSLIEIVKKCRKLKKDRQIGLIVIDHLQLMSHHKSKESKQQEVSEITRQLKLLAKELNVPIVVLSQLNRGVESRPDKRPLLSDLRESGSIEQDADVVMFLYRDEYYNPDTEAKGITEVIISKHRNGSTGVIELTWIGNCTKFTSLGDAYEGNRTKTAIPDNKKVYEQTKIPVYQGNNKRKSYC